MSIVHSAITTEFLSNILKKFNHDVTNLQFSIASLPTGENFTSDLHQVTINYENSSKSNKEISLVLKCQSKSEIESDYANLTKLFDFEIDMYNRILPNIYSLEYVNKFSATVLYAALTPEPILILEDLTKRGYKMLCRHKGLDLDHCMLVIEKLAYLHASSIAISKKESLSNFNLGIYCSNHYVKNWIGIGLKNIIETCTKFNHLNQYAAKMQSIKDNFFEKALASTKNTTVCNVLNYGDCWVNNLMFLYNNDGSVKEVILLDFQQCVYSSPVIDLHFFWATSVNSEVLTKHLCNILEYYYNEFFKNIQKLGIVDNVSNKFEIETDFKRKAIYGLMTLITATAAIKSRRTSDASMTQFLNSSGEGSFQHDSYNNERYIERITLLLPLYDSLGVFD